MGLYGSKLNWTATEDFCHYSYRDPNKNLVYFIDSICVAGLLKNKTLTILNENNNALVYFMYEEVAKLYTVKYHYKERTEVVSDISDLMVALCTISQYLNDTLNPDVYEDFCNYEV